MYAFFSHCNASKAFLFAFLTFFCGLHAVGRKILAIFAANIEKFNKTHNKQF